MNKKWHLIVFIVFLMFPLTLLSFRAEEVSAYTHWDDVQWVYPDYDYFLYDAGNSTWSAKVYWGDLDMDTDAYYEFMYINHGASPLPYFSNIWYNKAGYILSSSLDITHYTEQRYTEVGFLVNTTYLSVGETRVWITFRYGLTVEFSDDTYVYRREQTYGNDPPVITVNSPSQNEFFNVSEASITSSITVDDPENSLSSISVKWDGTALYTWTLPSDGTFSYDIPITKGVTTNGTHTITWDVIDSVSWNTSQDIDIVIYDSIITIYLEEPTKYISNQEPQFRVDFSTDDDLQDGLMYILGVDFENSSNRTVVITDVDSFWGYIQNISINENYRIHSLELSFSDIYKWMESEADDDTGSIFNTSSSSWYIDDDGVGWYVFNNYLIDGGDYYPSPTITSQDSGDGSGILSLMDANNIQDDGTVYPGAFEDFRMADIGRFGEQYFYYYDENGQLMPYRYDLGTRTDLWNDYTDIDDSGDPYWEFTDESEYIVDSGAYSSAIVSYEEDDMSDQESPIYKDITFTNPTATTFTNFVAYVSVTYDSDMESDFSDVRFYDSTGITLLDFDLGEYTASTTAHFWVEIPSFSGSGTYTSRMIYGDGASSLEDEQGTWDDNSIELAMHLDTNDDSSGNSYDFTDTGDGVSYSSSQIGSGVELQGTDDYLLLAQGSGATELHNLGTSYTIMSWMWCENDAYYCQYSMTADILSIIILPEVTTNDVLRIEADSEYKGTSVDSGATEDTYFHFATRIDGTDISYFIDGQEAITNTWTANLNEADNDIFIGTEQALNNDMDGFIDELYVISEVWSDHEIQAFYDFQYDDSYVSTSAESGGGAPWYEGSNFDWTVFQGTGDRNASGYMTFWNTTSGSYAYVNASDDNLANIKLTDDNYALSFEVNISSDTLTEIEAISFFIHGIDGYGLKMALDDAGYLYAGHSTQMWGINFESGYASSDISWSGEWITLNITILGHSKVLYYYNDILFRDSIADNEYYDYTDADSGTTTLAVDNDAGQVNGNLTVDYFNTSYFAGGRIAHGGQTYYEYSDPSCVRFNGSWYLSTQTANDVASLFSNWGGGAWHDYRFLDDVMYETRFRFGDEDVTSYNYWQTFGMCAKANVTANYYYQIQMRQDVNYLKFTMSEHVYGGYGVTYTAGDTLILDVFDGLWHTYKIIYRDNVCITAYVDDTLIANVTFASNPEWFEVWDSSDAENNIASWSIYNTNVGTQSAVMEIDYFTVYNYTYNHWTSDEGWDWTLGYPDYDESYRDDGYWYLATDSRNGYDKQYVFDPDSSLMQAHDYAEYFVECRVAFPNTTADYNNFVIATWLDESPWQRYATICWYTNGTIAFLITNGGVEDWWTIQTVFDTKTLAWDYDFHTLRIHVDTVDEWIAFGVDGTIMENASYSAIDYDRTTYSRTYLSFESDASITTYIYAKIDYLKTGITNDYWHYANTTNGDWDWNINDVHVNSTRGERDGVGTFSFWNIVDGDWSEIVVHDEDIGELGDGNMVETKFRALNSSSDYEQVIFGYRLNDADDKHAFIGGFENGTTWVGVSAWLNATSFYEATEISGVNILDGSWHVLRIYVDESTSENITFWIDGVQVHSAIYSAYSYHTDYTFSGINIHNEASTNNSMLEIDYFGATPLYPTTVIYGSSYMENGDGQLIPYTQLAEVDVEKNWDDGYFVISADSPSDSFGLLVYGENTSLEQSWDEWTIELEANFEDISEIDYSVGTLQMNATHWLAFWSDPSGDVFVSLTTDPYTSADNFYLWDSGVTMSSGVWYNYKVRFNETEGKIWLYANDYLVYNSSDLYSAWDDSIAHDFIFYNTYDTGQQDAQVWVRTLGFHRWNTTTNPLISSTSWFTYINMTNYSSFYRWGAPSDAWRIRTTANGTLAAYKIDDFDEWYYADEDRFNIESAYLLPDPIANYEYYGGAIKISTTPERWLWYGQYQNATNFVMITDSWNITEATIYESFNITTTFPTTPAVAGYMFDVVDKWIAVVGYGGSIVYNSSVFGSYMTATSMADMEMVIQVQATAGNNATWIFGYMRSGLHFFNQWYISSEGWDWHVSEVYAAQTDGFRNGVGNMYFWNTIDDLATHVEVQRAHDLPHINGTAPYMFEARLKAPNATATYDYIEVGMRLNESISKYTLYKFWTNGTVHVGVRDSYYVGGTWYEYDNYTFNFFDGNWHDVRFYMYPTDKTVTFELDGSMIANETYSSYTWGEFSTFAMLTNNSAGYNRSMLAMDYLATHSDYWNITQNADYWTHGTNTTGTRTNGIMTWWCNSTGDYTELYTEDGNFSISDGTEYDVYSIQAKIKIDNLTQTEHFTLALMSGASDYWKLIVWQNGSITVGHYTDSQYGGHTTSTWFQTINAGITSGTWHTYNISCIRDYNAFFYYDDIFLYGRIAGGEIYARQSYDYTAENRIYMIIDNDAGEVNATAQMDYLNWSLIEADAREWSDQGWQYFAYGEYIRRTLNGTASITTSATRAINSNEANLGETEWQDFAVETMLYFENASSYPYNTLHSVASGSFDAYAGIGTYPDNSSYYVGTFINSRGDPTPGQYYQYNFAGAVTYDAWVNYTIRFNIRNGWIAYYIDGVMARNSTDDMDDWDSTFPLSKQWAFYGYSNTSANVYMDYTRFKRAEINDWEISDKGWNWGYIQDSGHRYNWDEESAKEGYFEFWHDTNDGVNTITATATDLDIGTTSQYAIDSSMTFTNASSNYDYIEFGSQVYNAGTSIFSAKIIYDIANTRFACGLHNGTDWLGTPTNLTRTWGQNAYTEFRIQVDRTNGWISYFINNTYIVNSTTDGSYINMNSYKMDITVDNDASSSNAHVKIDYFQSGWDYKSQWYWSSEGWRYDFVDPFEISGTRSGGTVIYTSSSSDSNAIRINATDQYTVQQGYNVTSVHTKLRYLNTSASYDAIYYSLEINSTAYAVMKWNGSAIRFGTADSWNASTWYDCSDISFTWNQNTWEIFTIVMNSSAGWVALYNTSLTSTYFSENLLVNITSSYITTRIGSYLTYMGIDGNSVTQIEFDYIKSGYGYWQPTTAIDVGLNYVLNLTLPRTAWGEDLGITYNHTYYRIKFNSSVELFRYCKFYIIFDDYSGATYNDASWTLPTYAWNQLAEGEYEISLYVDFDSGGYFWYNFTMRKDITAPTLYAYLTPQSPVGNVYYADYPPGLYMQILWGANTLDPNTVRIEINDEDIVHEWSDTTELKPITFPSTITPITYIEGNHSVLVRALDYAGNEANVTINFQIIRIKPITFSFISAGDNIPTYIAENFIIEIDGFQIVGLEGSTIFDRFDVKVFDAFMQSIFYQEDVAYSRNIQISLNLRRITLNNLEQVPVEITVQKTSGEVHFTMASDSTKTYYLKDGTYKLVADPKGAMRTDTQQFVATDFSLSVSSGGSNNLDMVLDWIEVVGSGVFSLSRVISTMLNIAWVTVGIIIFMFVAIMVFVGRRLKFLEEVMTGQRAVKGKVVTKKAKRDTKDFQEYGNGKKPKKKKKGFFKKLWEIIGSR